MLSFSSFICIACINLFCPRGFRVFRAGADGCQRCLKMKLCTLFKNKFMYVVLLCGGRGGGGGGGILSFVFLLAIYTPPH